MCLRNMATGDILPNSESLKSHAEFMGYDYTDEDLNGALFIQSLRVLLMCHAIARLFGKFLIRKSTARTLLAVLVKTGRKKMPEKKSRTRN